MIQCIALKCDTTQDKIKTILFDLSTKVLPFSLCFFVPYSVAPKRIIIRQGHFAENFYFILSGNGMSFMSSHDYFKIIIYNLALYSCITFYGNNSELLFCPFSLSSVFIVPAVVTILLKDPKTGASFVKTATIMKKGMSFGVSRISSSLPLSVLSPLTNLLS